ncbi:MAG: TauD/TfdA family dioxygenase [bacterium]|nr:TauD/TfdA family dioxygenase [Gammaproteobacteria bacterium]HIL96018.1 TauD/TfdA family dioxygenase [Pseudomonadales bacterium]
MKFMTAKFDGIDPEMSRQDAEAARHLLVDNGVLHLPIVERLDKEGFAKISQLFGDVKDPVARTKQGDQYRYSEKLQHIDAGYVFKEADREKFGEMSFGGLDDERPGLFETYHCDDTYTEDPAQFTILHARALPQSGGGPTHFMDMRAAFLQLDQQEQARLRSFTVCYAYNNQNAFPPRRSATGVADMLIDVEHPLIRTHPDAGTEAIFVDLDRATYIKELPVHEGRQLLQRLQDLAEANAPKCEHNWQANDILIWDNASVQHKAGGDFAIGEERRFWRHMIAGPTPA